jgi:sugar phosphate isomerase/epimerase
MLRRTFAAALAGPLALPLALPLQARTGRLKPALCAYSFRNELQSGKLTYLDLVRIAQENQAEGLDLTVYWFPSTSASFLMPLRREAYLNGIEIYSISVRTDFCTPAGTKRDLELAAVKHWVDVASTLGAGHIRVFGGNVPQGGTEAQTAGWVAEALKRATDYSGSKGVILGLENHGGITDRAETILQIVNEVNSPWLGINLDTGNFKSDAYRQIAMCLPKAVNAQFKAEIRDEAGQTVESDWPRLVKMFAESGYRGYCAIEYEAKPPAMEAVPVLLRKLAAMMRAA